MIRGALKQITDMFLLLWIVSLLAFAALRLTPGDPALLLLGPQAGRQDNAEALKLLRAEMGLDRSVVIQYFNWLKQILTGNLGVSNRTNRPVLDLIIGSLPPTIWLIILSLVISILLAIILGISAAARFSTPYDRFVNLLSIGGVAIPAYWVGLLLIIIFSVKLGWLPSSGYVSPSENAVEFVRHMCLPVATLSCYLTGSLTRFVRVEALDVLGTSFSRTAIAMGLSRFKILYKYVLKNAAISLITMAGIELGVLVGGAVLVEEVFGLGGVGQLLLRGVLGRDYQVVQGTVLFVVATVIASSSLADYVYQLVNPRFRKSQ